MSTRHPHMPGSRLVPGYALHGNLQGSASIEQMQKSLQGLAQAAKTTAVNVTVTGVVDFPTIGAVSTMLGWAIQKLPAAMVPSLLKDVIRLAPLLALQPELNKQVVSIITQYAVQITAAARALAILYGAPAGAPPLPPNTAPGFVMAPVKATLVTAKTYPAGSIATQVATGTWRVAVPKGLAGLGDPFGAGGHVEVAPTQSATVPAGALAVSLPQFEAEITPPFYKNPKIMIPVGVGALAVVGGLFWFLKR